MEIKQLERFIAVIENESLSAAAKQLGLTQQAISISLAKLEEQIGLSLFDRSPGGITKPTEFGRALVRHARSQLASIERATEELHAIRDARTGTITIGIGESFVGEVTASAVSRMHNVRPEIRINLIEGYSEVLLERLREGEFDFVAGDTGDLQTPKDLIRELCYTSDDVISVRHDHPLANKTNLELADLQNYTWLVPYSRPADLKAINDTFLSENLDPPTKVIGSDAFMVGMNLLINNDFIIMTAPGLVNKMRPNERGMLTVLDIDKPTVKRHAHLIYSAQRPVSSIALLLMQEIRDSCALLDI